MVESGKSHRFGGDWTTTKLEVLKGYLQRYTTALKNQRFRKGYIDAFAGTGYRDVHQSDTESLLLFPDLAEDDTQGLLDGSATIALKTEPRFDKYIFIERREDRCAALNALKQEFPDKAKYIEIRRGDANQEIRKLCNKDWSSNRAVLFLDPYGMQVEWATIEAIARTKAIDLWLLFPLGIGVNRLLTKSGDIPNSWRTRLTALLGTDDWYQKFYKVTKPRTLLDDDWEQVEKVPMDVIGSYFNNRLKSVFAGVVEQPGVLRNKVNNPLYLLCFAVGNRSEAAKKLAIGIANHLLKGVR